MYRLIMRSRVVGAFLWLAMMADCAFIGLALEAPLLADDCPGNDCESGWTSSRSIVLGGVECSHGPDSDADCTKPPANLKSLRCCENKDLEIPEKVVSKPGVTPLVYLRVTNGQIEFYTKDANGNPIMRNGFPLPIADYNDANACRCYTCGNGCGDEYEYWLSDCGIYDDPPGKGENPKDGECPGLGNAQPNSVIKRFRKTDPPPGGAACNGGQGDHYGRKYFCGAPHNAWGGSDWGGVTGYADCLASNCPATGGAFTDENPPTMGTRYDCDDDN